MDIQQFRGIKSCKEPLEFSDFTVLIGRNNSGKSSILEALSLIPVPFNQFRVPYHSSGRIDLLSSLHGGTSSLVYAYSGRALIDYTVEPVPKRKNWRIELNADGRVSLSVPGFSPTAMSQEPGRLLAITLGMRKIKNAMERMNRMGFFIPNDTAFMRILFDQMGTERNRNLIMKTGAHTRVAKELINECVDDRYTEILFAPELSARKELPDGNVLYVKLRDLGDGVQKVALLVLWIEAMNPTLILWDDFEGSAHPTLIKLLLNWLSKKKWQVILSTHSIDVISSLLDVEAKNAKVIQLKKTAEDVLLHQDLRLEELESLIEANQDPRMLVDRLGL